MFYAFTRECVSMCHLRSIKALSPCGVSATGGRGQIYLAGWGFVPKTVTKRQRALNNHLHFIRASSPFDCLVCIGLQKFNIKGGPGGLGAQKIC